jgi:hypothetical protein
MEAVSGDGGAHNSGGVWWLSPDIELVGPTSGPDKADPGMVNSVTLTIHQKDSRSNCTLPPATESITTQLWVGNPSLAMSPNNPASTRLINFVGAPVPSIGGIVSLPIDWTPPDGVPSTDPESPGHKCLIARCYPDSLTPSNSNFFVPDDQHVAQRNICIVPCGGPGAARRPGPCGLDVTTVNIHADRAETVTLRAVVDLRPNKHVSQVVMKHLRDTHGFRRIASVPPQGFEFLLPDFPDARVADRARGGCLASLIAPRGQLTHEAGIELKAGQLTRFTFKADMSRASFGDAYIFHLTQVGTGGRVQGGLTIVMLAV